MKQPIRRVSFSENISNVKCYEYFRDDENEEKMGKDWQKTMDLTCREFFMPIEKGGCGRKWSVLQEKLDELGEPCWRMIGQLWNRLFPNRKRLEEESDDEDEYDSDIESNRAVCCLGQDSDSDSDSCDENYYDSKYNNIDNTFDDNLIFNFCEK